MNTRHVTSLVAAGAAIVMLLSGCDFHRYLQFQQCFRFQYHFRVRQ